MQISATIITKNEEQALPKCIENVRDVVEEIVVVDSGSTDKTLEIAKSEADVAVVRAFENFSKQKNHAASLAKYPWILNIDADELLSKELKQRILKIKEENNPRHRAYCFPRKTFGRDGSMLFNIVSY